MTYSRRLVIFVTTVTIFLSVIGFSAQADTSPYYITVDCYNNIVTVYSTADDSIVRQMICSTGTSTNATPKGTFTLPETRRSSERGDWYEVDGGYVKYATRIHNGVLFHSYPFSKADDDAASWVAYCSLGTNASHGCIRLYIEDAKWIAENCFAGTKVKIYEADTRNNYIKELLFQQTYSIDSGLTYQAFASMASDDTELGYGSEGDEVLELQARLIELGLYSGEANGTYGEALVTAVKSIQTVLGLDATGVVDEDLRARLSGEDAPCSTLSTLAEGASGPAVIEMQSLLASLGLYTGELDGAFDTDTKEAVILFQKVCGYEETGIATASLIDDMSSALSMLESKYGEGNYALIYEDVTDVTAVSTSEINLNIREKASTESDIIGKLKPGTVAKVVSRGKRWTKISADGVEGYARTSYLDFTEETVSVPKYIEADGAYAALAIVASPVAAIGTHEVTYGVVNISSRLSVRKSPSEDAKLTFIIPSKTKVRILSVSHDWAFISYGGKTGYTKIAYLDTATVMELSGTAASGSGASASDEDTTILAYVLDGSGTVVYSTASDAGDALTRLSAGDSAKVIFQSTSWTQVKTDDVTGYVSNDSIFIGTRSEIDAYLADLSSTESSYAIVSTGSGAQLNMRATAAADAEIICAIDDGTIVEVVENDEEWSKIESNSVTGYVMSQYLLAIDESGGEESDAASYEDIPLEEDSGETADGQAD